MSDVGLAIKGARSQVQHLTVWPLVFDVLQSTESFAAAETLCPFSEPLSRLRLSQTALLQSGQPFVFERLTRLVAAPSIPLPSIFLFIVV